MLFITLRKFPSVPSLLRALVMTDNAFYPVLFLHLLQCTVFLLYSVNVVNYFGFQILNQPCIPPINPTWTWCIILFIYCMEVIHISFLLFKKF